jgi:Flp pilus assembly protein TadD
MLNDLNVQKEARMIGRIGRGGLVIITVIVLIALVGVAAGCGEDETTTTVTSPTATTAGESTDTTTGESTDTTAAATDATMVEGGKTLEQYAAEIPGLEEALAADPTDLFALESLAVAHFQLGEYEEAESAYQRILAIQEDAFTRNNLGNVYRDWGKTEEAKAAYWQAIQDDPTLKYPYVNLAGVLQKEGDVAGALKVLQDGAKFVGEEGQSIINAAEERLTSTTTT